MASLANSFITATNTPSHFFSSDFASPGRNLSLIPVYQKKGKFSTLKRSLTVQAGYSGDAGRPSSASIFVGGFILGGIVIGTLGCVYAPQMVRARVAYQDQEGSPFPFDHCYLMLKDTPKWHRSMETKTKPKTSKKIQGEGSSNVNDSQTPICLDEDVNAPTMTTSDLIRPDGVKKQKERKRRASEAAKVVEGFVSRVELRMEKQNKLLETQLQSKDRDQELKNKKIEAMERREEAKIMAMDLSVLPDFRREYFEAKQVEIYKKWKGDN